MYYIAWGEFCGFVWMEIAPITKLVRRLTVLSQRPKQLGFKNSRVGVDETLVNASYGSGSDRNRLFNHCAQPHSNEPTWFVSLQQLSKKRVYGRKSSCTDSSTQPWCQQMADREKKALSQLPAHHTVSVSPLIFWGHHTCVLCAASKLALPPCPSAWHSKGHG